MEGWKDYLRDPSLGNALIKKLNPRMPDEHIKYSFDKMREVKAVQGGDAATMGIGIMTEERWKKTYEFLVQAKLLKPGTDWKQVFTTDYIKDLQTARCDPAKSADGSENRRVHSSQSLVRKRGGGRRQRRRVGVISSTCARTPTPTLPLAGGSASRICLITPPVRSVPCGTGRTC